MVHTKHWHGEREYAQAWVENSYESINCFWSPWMTGVEQIKLCYQTILSIECKNIHMNVVYTYYINPIYMQVSNYSNSLKNIYNYYSSL